jgi:conjugative transfer pilus assembly protein TraH
MHSSTPRTSCVKAARPLRSIARSAVATLVAVSLVAAPLQNVRADINDEMQDMFNALGAANNVTAPGAFRAQTMNIYTGGELQMRSPIRSTQMWSVAWPSINAGCGGIDAFLGSFSHINGEQFKAFLQQIGANTVGLLFKAALKSINPMIESVIGDLQHTLDMIGSANRNSCQMAEALVSGMQGVFSNDANAKCISQAMVVYGDDQSAAQMRCRDSASAVNADTAASSDPATKEMAQRDINLIWDALRDSSLTTDEKETFLNIAGSVLMFKAANNDGQPQSPRDLDPSIDSLNTLLRGHADGSSADTVVVKNWWSCPDAECMNPQQGDKTLTPFTTYVRRMLTDLRDAMEAKTALDPGGPQVAFVNTTSIPVWRMLAVGYMGGSASGTQSLTDVLIARYAQVIAYDYAYSYLGRALKDVRVYIGNARLQNKAEEDRAAHFRQRIDAMLTAIDQEKRAALGKTRDINAVVDDIEHIERQLRTNLPATVRNMMDFSNLITGRIGRG